jgi:hypothetical protein
MEGSRINLSLSLWSRSKFANVFEVPYKALSISKIGKANMKM